MGLKQYKYSALLYQKSLYVCLSLGFLFHNFNLPGTWHIRRLVQLKGFIFLNVQVQSIIGLENIIL